MSFARIRVVRRVAAATGRLAKYVGILAVIAVFATVVVVSWSGDDEFRFSATDDLVNDVTSLNPIRVEQVARPTSPEEVAQLITSTQLPISVGGGRFSQGGQIGYPESLHIDMRGMNRVLAIDAERKLATVQAGATWRDLQAALDPYDLSVRIMQTYANFTVGGSLSVNVHGRYIGEGPLVRSVKSIRMVLADGSIVQASPDRNSDLFFGAIGGYGGLGVIVEATLALADNARIERRTQVMNTEEYGEYFTSAIRDNPDVVLHNADVYPPNYSTVRDVSWFVTDKDVTIDDRLIPTDVDYWWQPAVASFVGNYTVGKLLRQYILEPIYYMEKRVAWRNWEASYDVRELEPDSRDEATYVLREYFVPVENLYAFIPKMVDIFERNDANILNVSIRHALPDSGTLLAWASTEVFAFVVYYKQGTDDESRQAVEAWSIEMIDAVIDVGGTWYLPYQVFASPEQFVAGYPRAEEFFDLKRRVDPDNRFRNALWVKHYPENQDPMAAAKADIPSYARNEEQTMLTIPEWYLVFNPEEYADYLEAGRNPSDFPFFRSIGEYWRLYDRSQAVAKAYQYPANPEYQTMLKVIGYSTTLEYLVKGSYETTVGRLTRWIAGGEDTAEDLIMQDAYRAYSDLIFREAWYEFDFLQWVARIWSEPEFLESNFIRKTERKIFFTMEFSIKHAYAWLIKLAAESTYGETDSAVYATVIAPQDADPVDLPADVSRIAANGDSWLIRLPRWGGFTDTVPGLLQDGYTFSDISGNQRIVLTVVQYAGSDGATLPAKALFRSELVSNPGLERVAYLAKVGSLADVIQAAQKQQAVFRLEHLYDY